MKIIELTNVGDLDWNWFWCDKKLQQKMPFHSFMSFIFFDVVNKIKINADCIVELKDGYPVVVEKKEKYIKRCKFIEFLFGKKYDIDFKHNVSKEKVTWIKLSSGNSFYVSETIDEINNLVNADSKPEHSELNDELEEAHRTIADLRKDIVTKNCCVHYKGMHENNYEDCMVVCDLHDDDYVSRDMCAHCEDCELRHET